METLQKNQKYKINNMQILNMYKVKYIDQNKNIKEQQMIYKNSNKNLVRNKMN